MKRISILCVLSVFFVTDWMGGGGGGMGSKQSVLNSNWKKISVSSYEVFTKQASKPQATCIRRKLPSSSISL